MSARKTILITGANGLLGAEVSQLLSESYDVHAVVHSMPKEKLPNVTYHEIDFSENWSTISFPDNIDTVFHFAQSAKFREFPEMAMDVFRVNVESTAKLLDYAQKIKVNRFVYASSGGVYGTGEQAFHENSPIPSHRPLGYYLGSKLCGEVLAQSYASSMHVIIPRFFFMYGPKQKRSMLIPRLIDNVKEGRPISIQGKEGLSINPIHVNDAAKCMQNILSLSQSVTLNLAGPEIISLYGIAKIAGDYLDKEPVFEYQNKQPENLIANIDAMKSILTAPSVTLRESIAEMADQ